MTTPTGPCACDRDVWERGTRAVYQLDAITPVVAHEHSDFEPFACVDCECPGWRPPPAADQEAAETPSDAPDRVAAATALTVPDKLRFADERAARTVEWVDQLVIGLHETMPTEPDDPLAVCAVADMLEQAWPEDIDPLDAVALLIRRQAAIRNTPAHRALDAIRRKVQR